MSFLKAFDRSQGGGFLRSPLGARNYPATFPPPPCCDIYGAPSGPDINDNYTYPSALAAFHGTWSLTANNSGNPFTIPDNPIVFSQVVRSTLPIEFQGELGGPIPPTGSFQYPTWVSPNYTFPTVLTYQNPIPLLPTDLTDTYQAFLTNVRFLFDCPGGNILALAVFYYTTYYNVAGTILRQEWFSPGWNPLAVPNAATCNQASFSQTFSPIFISDTVLATAFDLPNQYSFLMTL